MKRKDRKDDVVQMTMNVIKDNMPNINIQGDKEISIENHGGVEVFSEKKIVVKSTIGNIVIEGKDFEIIYLSANAVIIKGTFDMVKVERSDVHE